PLFHAALAKPAAERAAFLDAACEGQPQLRAAVEALLAAHDASDGYLENPSAPSAATGEYTPGTEAGRQSRTSDDRPTHTAAHVIAGRYTLVEVIGEGGTGVILLNPIRRRQLRLPQNQLRGI